MRHLAVAVAGLAVNSHIWGLGRQVVIGCANTLAESDWGMRALREQREAIEAQHTRVKAVEAIGVLSDGETFSTLAGCRVFEVPADWDTEPIEEVLAEEAWKDEGS